MHYDYAIDYDGGVDHIILLNHIIKNLKYTWQWVAAVSDCI